jgi:hypothetical protein
MLVAENMLYNIGYHYKENIKFMQLSAYLTSYTSYSSWHSGRTLGSSSQDKGFKSSCRCCSHWEDKIAIHYMLCFRSLAGFEPSISESVSEYFYQLIFHDCPHIQLNNYIYSGFWPMLK